MMRKILLSRRVLAVALALVSSPLVAQEPPPPVSTEVTFRVRVVGGVEETPGDVANFWTIPVVAPIPEFVDVDVEVAIVSAMTTCIEMPEACTGDERLALPEDSCIQEAGCSDEQDNDGDGLVDGADPDCRGIRGWSLALATDSEFHLEAATSDGTVASLRFLGPPGLRDCNSGHTLALIDPAENGGQEGIVHSTILSLTQPLTLDPLGEEVVLRFHGRVSTAGLAENGQTAPVLLRILGANEEGLIRPETGGIPQSTRATICATGDDCDSVQPIIESASLRLTLADDAKQFTRGDVNSSGALEITDGIRVLNYLFLGHAEPSCRDAADANDDGAIDSSDGVAIFRFLFLDVPTLPAPGPRACGIDPTRDEIRCASFAACG